MVIASSGKHLTVSFKNFKTKYTFEIYSNVEIQQTFLEIEEQTDNLNLLNLLDEYSYLCSLFLDRKLIIYISNAFAETFYEIQKKIKQKIIFLSQIGNSYFGK